MDAFSSISGKNDDRWEKGFGGEDPTSEGILRMSLNQSDIDSLLSGEAEPDPGPAAGPAVAQLASDNPPKPGEVRRILGLPVQVTVMLSSRDMPIGAILDLTVGTILEFEEQFDADLILKVVDHPIGRGQAVKVGENFGLRITGIGSVRERIGAMGGS